MAKRRGFETEAIHLSKKFGERGALNVPIYQNSTFAQVEPGKWEDYTYTRTNNPTEEALRNALSVLEGGAYGIITSSGLAAINALCEMFDSGDHIVSTADVYGGTYRLFTEFVAKRGIEFSFVESKDITQVSGAVRENTKLIYVETPSNPLLEITDIPAIARIAKSQGALLAVDNTMATPYFQKPLELGADIVIHSLSKYISGHTNVIGGALIVKDDSYRDQIKFIRKATGANPAPFDCYLTLLGLKTLALRMRRHEENALRVAKYLVEQPRVVSVRYPGLSEHPQHELAKKQMSGFGGIVSFELDGDEKVAKKFIQDTELFTISISFGSVASFISYPAQMSHKDMPREERIKRGFSDSLVRLSLGIEDVNDLISALDGAFSKMR
ncbi:MAG: PLP-dependent transferase [Bdellovibrionales bacterium]|nr:PLP-dependent transferase [Bdellovibrionales bacterium]